MEKNDKAEWKRMLEARERTRIPGHARRELSIRFLRTTHKDGVFLGDKNLGKDNVAALASFVVHLLDPKEPMDLATILTHAAEHDLDNEGAIWNPEEEAPKFLAALSRLISVGYARPVAEIDIVTTKRQARCASK